MQQDKALLRIDERTLIERAIDFARATCETVRVVGDHAHLAAFGEVVPDVRKGSGPLAGICAALKDSDTEWNLILAVDQLAYPRELLSLLFERAEDAKEECLAVVPVVGEREQPLCAMYRRGFYAIGADALQRDLRKIGALFGEAHVEFIAEEEIVAAGVDLRCFENLNTPADYDAAIG